MGAQQESTLYFNYLEGGPGSSFLVTGYSFPVGGQVQLSINGVDVGSSITVGSDGQFSSLIATSGESAEGYYVLSANTTVSTSRARMTQNGRIGSDQQSYRLVSDVPLRAAPAGAPAAVPVPEDIPAFDRPPVVYLPMIRR